MLLHAWLIMFFTHSSASELVGLLLELNDAIEQLEKIDPLLSMVYLFYFDYFILIGIMCIAPLRMI